MNIFDKDYKMLKALEKEAKPRSAVCDGTTSTSSRLSRLLELGYIIPNSAGEPEPNKEIKFMLSGEGRAYIQDTKRRFILNCIKVAVCDVLLPLIVAYFTAKFSH